MNTVKLNKLNERTQYYVCQGYSFDEALKRAREIEGAKREKESDDNG